MAKTKPIGVRFSETVLDRFRKMEINSPQKALNFMEGLFMRTTDGIGKVVADTKPNREPAKKIKETASGSEPSGVNIEDDKQRIKDLEKELSNPPKTAIIGVRNWIRIREKEVAELKLKING